MLKHIILWDYADGLSDAEKPRIGADIKSALEGLLGQIPGLLEISVVLDPLPSSSAELALYSVFTDEAALAAYQTHSAHQYAANTFVRPFTKNRKCIDFLVESRGAHCASED